VCIPAVIESRYLYAADGKPPFDRNTPWPDPWAAISAMAAVTQRLRFGTSIYLAGLRHPLLVAKSVATASILSGGRVMLGVGAGWLAEEFEILGEDFGTRGARLDEMLDVCRALWTGASVEHRGRFYDFPAVSQAPAPPERIPIYVGGASRAALRRAARHDGWLGTGNDPSEVDGLVAALRAYRAEAGRADDEFDVVLALAAPPEPELFRSLEGRGVTSIVSYPPAFTIGPGASLAHKKRALERYGSEVIRRC
jgi:probable F420-dependent oxidoreductase